MSNETPKPPYTHFNPVTVRMSETAGIVFLGVLAVLLLIALLRAQARNREMLAERFKEGRGD